MDEPDTAGREHDEEEIWRDLVSRFDDPAADEEAAEAAPWPAEENVDARLSGTRVIKPADPDARADEPAAAHRARRRRQYPTTPTSITSRRLRRHCRNSTASPRAPG